MDIGRISRPLLQNDQHCGYHVTLQIKQFHTTGQHLVMADLLLNQVRATCDAKCTQLVLAETTTLVSISELLSLWISMHL